MLKHQCLYSWSPGVIKNPQFLVARELHQKQPGQKVEGGDSALVISHLEFRSVKLDPSNTGRMWIYWSELTEGPQR